MTPDRLTDLLNQEQSLQTWNNWIAAFNVIVLVLTLVSGAAGFYVNRLLTKASDQRSELEKQRSEQKIAYLNNKTQEAEAKIQQSIFESQKGQKQLADKQIELAQAQEKQAQAETARLKLVEEIKAKQGPRTLTDKQSKELSNLLSRSVKGPVRFLMTADDQETIKYADKIMSALRDAGWGYPDSGTNTYDQPDVDGVRLIVKDLSRKPQHLKSIIDGFTKVGIRVFVEENNRVGEGSPGSPAIPDVVIVAVGAKVY